MLQYNSQSGNYQDELPDGSTMIVDADAYAEAVQDRIAEGDTPEHAEAEVSNPSNWTEDMFGVEIKK